LPSRMLKKGKDRLLTRAAQKHTCAFATSYRAATVREFPMARGRATKGNEDAAQRPNRINNLDRVFRGAVTTTFSASCWSYASRLSKDIFE
jgi:hypothetical protein